MSPKNVRLSRRTMLKWIGLGTASAWVAGCGAAAVAPTAAPAAKPAAAATTAPAAAAPTTAPAAPAATAVAPAAPKASGPVNITFTSQGNPAELKMFDAIIDGFNASQKDVKVEKKYDTTITWPKAINMLRTGTAADVIQQDDDALYLLAAAGLLTELDDYFAKDLKKEDYFDLPWKQRTGPGGAMVSAFVGSMNHTFVANKAIFDKKGIKLPTDWVNDAWTIEQFEDVLKEVAEIKGDRVETYACYMANWFSRAPLYNHGCNYWNADETKAEWYSEASVDFFTRWTRWFKNKWAMPASENVTQLFNSGLIALRGNYPTDAIQADKAIDVEIVPIWKGKARTTTPQGGRNFCIPASSKNKDAAWQLLKYFLTASPDNSSGGQVEIAKLRWGIPMLKRVARAPVFMDKNLRYKNINLEPRSLELEYAPVPKNPACEAWMIVFRRMDAMNQGKQSIEDYLKIEADAFLNKQLTEMQWNKSKDVKGYRIPGIVDKMTTEVLEAELKKEAEAAKK